MRAILTTLSYSKVKKGAIVFSRSFTHSLTCHWRSYSRDMIYWRYFHFETTGFSLSRVSFHKHNTLHLSGTGISHRCNGDGHVVCRCVSIHIFFFNAKCKCLVSFFSLLSMLSYCFCRCMIIVLDIYMASKMPNNCE